MHSLNLQYLEIATFIMNANSCRIPSTRRGCGGPCPSCLWRAARPRSTTTSPSSISRGPTAPSRTASPRSSPWTWVRWVLVDKHRNLGTLYYLICLTFSHFQASRTPCSICTCSATRCASWSLPSSYSHAFLPSHRFESLTFSTILTVYLTDFVFHPRHITYYTVLP